jgi:methyl-accepting chemotaxis protein
MKRILQLAGILALLTLAFVLGELGYTVHKARPEILASLNLSATVQKMDTILTSIQPIVALVNQTLVNVNRPCHGPFGPDACGTLAQINKVAIAAADVANASAKQVEQSGTLITATTKNIDTIGSHLSGTADTASTSLQDITKHITPVLDSTNAAVQGLAPIEVSANKTVADLDAEIQNPDLQRILANVADMTLTGTHMMKTTDAVETKLTQCTLRPTISCTLKSDVLFGAQVGGYILGAIH